MTFSFPLPRGRRLAIAAALAATVGWEASAQVTRATAIRDTSAMYTGRWPRELPMMFGSIATLLDSGFAAPERDFVLHELRDIRPRERPTRYGPFPARSFAIHVKFRGRPSVLAMHVVWPDTNRVLFRVHSPNTQLIGAIDSVFRATRVPLLSPPARVRVAVGNSYVSEGVFRQIQVGLATDVANHCPLFGLETHGEARGDTLAIHIDGAAPRSGCLDQNWPPRMSYWLPVTPGVYHLVIDNRADTNRFTVRVTDTTIAVSTIRSSFATVDERLRWRVPRGSFVLTCGQYDSQHAAVCGELQTWVASRPGLQRIAFDTTDVSPVSSGAMAYRYADDRVLANTRACIHATKSEFRRSAYVELYARPRSGPWIVDRGTTMNADSEAPDESACTPPPSIGAPPRTFTFDGRPLNCPTPTPELRRVVASVLQRSEGTPEWFRGHGGAVLTTEGLQPLSRPAEAARCRAVDSASSRHPVYLFRAGRYFVATTADAVRPDIPLDGPFPLYLAWVLDSASNVVHVPGYSSLDMFSSSRRATPGENRPAAAQPRRDTLPAPMQFSPLDVRVSSTRGGDVVLQWTRPPRAPIGLALERAEGAGAFTSLGVALQPTALATMDTTPLPDRSYRYRLRARLPLGDTAYSNEVSVTMPRQPTPRLAWTKQLYRRPALHGRVFDSLTGEPLRNLHMSLREGGLIARTDSLGRYLYSDALLGTHEVRFTCPTKRTRSVRIGATQRIEVSPQTDSVIDFYVHLRNCEELPLRTWSGEFRGHYTYGFETSMFAPCVPFESFVGTALEGIDRGFAWVNFSEAAGAQAGSMWPRDMKPAQEYGPFYVRWRATVEGPATYGHMGVSNYAMKVTEVFEVRHAAPSDCQQQDGRTR
ncbi:MAG: hypothetical protein ACJ8AD_20040 [Gemmatimonadaceae bacterium]